jgi:hypothetical protein
MWEIVTIDRISGNVYLMHNTRTDGYLSDNGSGGGALHFIDEEEARQMVDLLNSFEIH